MSVDLVISRLLLFVLYGCDSVCDRFVLLLSLFWGAGGGGGGEEGVIIANWYNWTMSSGRSIQTPISILLGNVVVFLKTSPSLSVLACVSGH